jgi:hypothetical protein
MAPRRFEDLLGVGHNTEVSRAALLVLSLSGCGRVGFDATFDSAVDGAGDGGGSGSPTFTYSNAMGWGTLSTGTTYTQSYTVTAGSPAVLVVTAGGDSTSSVVSVTFGGIPMVRGDMSAGDTVNVSMFYLANPPAMTGNLVATYPQPMARSLMAVVLEGVAAASPTATARSTRSTGPISTSVTVPSAPAVLVDALGTYNATSPAAVGESGQVILRAVSAGGFQLGAMSLKPVATVGPTDMSWNAQNGADDYCHIILAFADD